MADISTAQLPPAGHNKPPSDVEILGEQLTLRHVQAMRAAETHLAVVAQMPDHFTDENEATYTSDLMKLMQNLVKELERRRKEEKDPYLRQGQYVDSFFGEFSDKLQAGIKKAEALMTDWLKRKADAEQAARAADAKMIREQQEAALKVAVAAAGIERPAAVNHAVELTQQVKVADAIAAAPIASMAASTGKVSRAALATKWVGEITDIDQLELIKLRPYIARAALQDALDRYVRQGGRQCEGAKITETMQAKVK